MTDSILSGLIGALWVTFFTWTEKKPGGSPDRSHTVNSLSWYLQNVKDIGKVPAAELKKARLPDYFIVDYVRVYDEY